ncbi:unnamed protein product [Malus baccata var. baccata]
MLQCSRFLLFKTSQEAVIVVLRSSNYKEHSFSDFMEDTEMTPIFELWPYIKAEKIKARVCRIWKSTIPGTTQKYTSLHWILLDEMVRKYCFIILMKNYNKNDSLAN